MFLKWGQAWWPTCYEPWFDYKLKQMPRMGIKYFGLMSLSLVWTPTTLNQNPHKLVVDLKLGS